MASPAQAVRIVTTNERMMVSEVRAMRIESSFRQTASLQMRLALAIIREHDDRERKAGK
ncbi:hypothetical protein LGH82_03115 [Mesorhizobium sp. PAMC28654]|uniref:hypothetical protein n=1 Tax=Mesorhizobium sp. PAMC28654 TaxID=2880934 RepID=UPI001D0B3172|nr:hypothetical protein [Mesorhizobium sp. PAMC28654]UDL92977.1 hypothetical protein LGH82_03115 [Mesorhizobium sp. PAMC28654]